MLFLTQLGFVVTSSLYSLCKMKAKSQSTCLTQTLIRQMLQIYKDLNKFKIGQSINAEHRKMKT